jgi:thymidine kinase
MRVRKFEERPGGRIEVTDLARQQIQVFKPRADDRNPPELLITRDNRELAARTVESSGELQAAIEDSVEVVGIDEAQFFDDGLVEVVTRLADEGLRVIVAGLDQDYLRRPFGPMPSIMAVAELVDKTHAVCVRCGRDAHYSQRIAGGDQQVEVGDLEAYEARCRECYEPYSSWSGD